MGNEPRVIHKATLAVGDFIERKYRVVRLLDEGGMGCVYHAIHEPLGRDVAVKVLKPVADEEPEKRDQRHRRFLREASLSSRLNHPNTITIFDYGELDDNRGFFFVMEFLEGMSLRDLLSSRGAFEVSTAIHIATQIASSLSDAHSAGVIHRDLKPPNVMLVRRGQDPYFVKVVDFGLVKDISDDSDDDTLTAENTFVGSPLYMAPERFLSKNADSPSVDIYALGVVLYEMLAGRPPFVRNSESTLHQLIMQHIQADPPPMRSFKPDLVLPDGLEALVMKCLAKQPERRFESMDSMVRLLNACASGQPSPGPGPQQGGGRSMPFNPAGMALSVGEDATSDAFRKADTGVGSLQDTGEHTLQDIPSNIELRDPKLSTLSEPEASITDKGETLRKKNPVLIAALVIPALIIAIIAVYAFTASPGHTEFTLNSDPPGAFVYLDNRFLGQTPLKLELSAEGDSALRFSQEGYSDYFFELDGTQGAALSVHAVLSKAPVLDEQVPDPVEDRAKEDEEIAEKAPEEAAIAEQEAVKQNARPKANQARTTTKSKSGSNTAPAQAPTPQIKLDR